MPDAPLLDHVAFGVPEVAPVAAFLVGELGGRERISGPGGGFRFWQWEFAGGGAIEIIEPDGPPGGFLHRFLDAHGAAPHHVTFKVPDIRAALDSARQRGYEPIGFDDRWPAWIEAFLHPKQAQGIVVQLVEAHPELEAGEDYETPAFPPVPATAEPVELVGVRLAAASESAAVAQWEALLGGTCARTGELWTFRWNDSPLRIAVQIDASRPPGPIALEVASDRKLVLPEGPHPLLGVPLLQVEE